MGAILQWNIRGLNCNVHELSLLLKDINSNVICLSETKLSENQSFSLKGYSAYHNIYTEGEIACGGASILVKKATLHKVIPIKTSLQAIAVRATLHRPITICSLYLPPSSKPSRRDLENLLEQLPAPFLLVGDFNARSPMWGNPDTNRKGNMVEDFLLKNNVCLLNDCSHTHLDSSTGKTSSLDLSICDPEIQSDFSWSVSEDLYGSDHFPIFISPITIPKTCLPQKWNFKKADWTAFSADCEKQLNLQSEVSSYESFTERLLSICDKHIPKTSGKPRRNKTWFSDECRAITKKKKQALRKFIKTKSPEDQIQLKKCRAEARRILRSSKRGSFKKYISKINNQTPMNKIWKIVNKLRGTHSGDAIKHIHLPDGSVSESEVDVANAIAKTLAQNSSSENYNDTFLKHKQKVETEKLNFSSSNEDYNIPLSLRELKLSISKLSDTAPGPDKIHNQIIGHLPDESLLLLLKFFNDFWQNNTFPDSWRQATVVPIPKPQKDHTNPNNYRPISLTNCFCKLMEKVVNARLMWYLEDSKSLSNLQCGFRTGRSTVDHLVRLETFIRKSFARGEHMVAVFFDLEKAFDTTWKHGIMKDLHSLGLRGHLPLFIQNFLANRKFNVKINNTQSDPFDQEEGVPQGSILSPILFEIKINSIIEILNPNMESSLYVDDFCLIYSSKGGMPLIERQIQLQLGKLETWANQNGFKFSPTKTTAVHFCEKKKCIRDPDLFLYKSRLPVKDSVRFLGVIFDKRLSFLIHIKDLRIRCLNALNALRVFCSPKWGGTSDILLNLYRSIVRSRLDYASFVYGSARQSYTKMLDPIHNQGLRLALGAFRTSPVESLYAEANEPPLHLRRRRLGQQYLTKLYSNPDNPAFNCVFNLSNETKRVFEKCPNKIPPLGVRVTLEDYFEDIDLNNEIEKFSIPKTPPWTFPEVEIDFSMAVHGKSNTSPREFQRHFEELLSKYPNFNGIYTDGSKDEDGVGAACFSSTEERQKGLNYCASIFSAEASALEMALDSARASTKRKHLILSDSLSLLQAVKNGNLKDVRILKIYEKLVKVENRGKTVVLAWIPGHCGISGNEKADHLAKEATGLRTSREMKIPTSDFKPIFKKELENMFNNNWGGQVGNKLKEILPNIRPRKPVTLPRHFETLFTRLKIGHTALTHKFLFEGESPPECVGCDERLTIKHILIDCVDFEDSRKKYFRTKSLKTLFDVVDPMKILSFVAEIGLMRKL